MLRRREKKFEAVFKMQFQVTQLPPLKAKGLMISLVPVDAEKPTARLDRAKIIEGTCTWEDPVYETVRLVQEIRTGRIREKFYYFIVSTGSSKSGFLGEVTIDFADLAEATKAMDLVLPLQTSTSGAILHVTVQRMPEDQNSRSTGDGEFLDAETRDRRSYGNRSLHSTGIESEAPCHERHGRHGGSGDSGSVNNRIKMLERKAEVAEMEVQSLMKRIVKETNKGQQLSETTACLKEEKDTIKTESQWLRPDLHNETESMELLLESIKEELRCEKHLNDKQMLQLQKTEDSNSEFVIASRNLNKKLDQKNAEISQLSSKIKDLRSEKMDQEEKLLKRTIENLNYEIEVHKKEKEDMLMEVNRFTMDGENIEKASKQIYATLQRTEKEKMDVEQNYAESLATVKQLELQVETLEEENERQQLQYSESLTVIKGLENQVKNLQKELENRAQLCEEELNIVAQEKIELEQRAMRAEESFRKARRNHTYRVEQLQEEIKKLSDEVSLQIEENEKLAQKSIAEATDLLRRNEVLESLIQKAEEDHQITRTEYERNVLELKDQNKRTYIKEQEDLERQLASVREEVDKLKQENISMKSQIDQKNSKEVNLSLEVKKLRLKNNEMKNHLSQVESEKEDLKKEVAKLHDGFQTNKAKNTNASRAKARSVDGLTKQTELDTAQIKSLLDEVESLKERNRSTEESLNEMNERYSEISLRFAEVEGERQHLVMTLRNLKSGKKN